MFSSCYEILALELSNFNTSKVKTMDSMFEACRALTSLNLLNFNTSKVIEMDFMFNGCSSISSLNLSSFSTSKVTDMHYMFNNCNKLTSLDLSNFDTALVNFMDNLFSYCSKLEYINLENSRMNANYYSAMITSTPNELIVCNKHRKWNDLLNGIENIHCHNLYNSIQENQFKCYQKNVKNTQSNNKNICGRCGLNYYKMFNDTKNNNTYSYCYKEPEGYYFDEYDKVYKECYFTMQKM